MGNDLRQVKHQHFTVQLSLSKWLPRRRSIVPPTRTFRSALKSVKANSSSALHVSLLPSTIPSSMSPISLAAKPSAVLLEAWKSRPTVTNPLPTLPCWLLKTSLNDARNSASTLCTSRSEPLAVTARRLAESRTSLLHRPTAPDARVVVVVVVCECARWKGCAELSYPSENQWRAYCWTNRVCEGARWWRSQIREERHFLPGLQNAAYYENDVVGMK